ncbi:MAG: UvrD-helicase domain-containing protein, partial [Oceanihabitans sp.]
MKPKNPFTIYDASAGSGKTYTLVKAYLKIVLQSSFNDSFKNILAITFTNKAVAEMKERILEMLTQFSSKEMLLNPNSMFSDLVQELSIEPVELQKKSKYVLDNILYNYAAFDVSTIDGFMHKIIRTFAYDLKMPLNFEVELDTDSLLQEAVDSLIEKAGSDTILTKVLVDFAIEKTDADKSWDIAFDFNKIAKLLVRENDIFFIDKLKDKSLADFSALKKQLKKDINLLESQIVDLAQNTLQLITNSGLQFNDFSGGYLPKHFNNLANKKLDISFTSSWQIKLLENESLYPKRVSPEIASIIDGIQADLIRAFTASQKLVFHFKFLKAFYKNTTPLSVLNAINKELEFIKEDQNKILISEFNTIINNEIKKQPTPFIYERLGEKFKHYFIDE